ncbi:MAG: hypothetical protein PHC61_16045 [Chitinivibrionales bacterium]|nr:hypothetical protein [Chitinivibrionales bacterium]
MATSDSNSLSRSAGEQGRADNDIIRALCVALSSAQEAIYLGESFSGSRQNPDPTFNARGKVSKPKTKSPRGSV